MSSYEIRNGRQHIEIVRCKHDQATYKKFEDVRAAAIAELNLSISKYKPVDVKDVEYWAMIGKRNMLLACTEETCDIIVDEDAPGQMPAFPSPDVQT